MFLFIPASFFPDCGITPAGKNCKNPSDFNYVENVLFHVQAELKRSEEYSKWEKFVGDLKILNKHLLNSI